jgi:co-chaperonin GroES (HSP10)
MHDFSLSDITDLDPNGFAPHGDRYVVEKCIINNDYIVTRSDGSTKTIHVEGTTDKEERDGYYIARIVVGGNGHRMDTDVTVPMPFKPGEIVMVVKFSGQEIKIADATYTVINQTDILMRLPELEEIDRRRAAESRLIEAVTSLGAYTE